MNYLISILLTIFFVTSCKSDKNIVTPESVIDQTSLLSSNDPVVQNTMKLLQGTWNSRDDKNTSLTFENNTRIENRDGKPIGRIRYYEIADQCNNDTAKGNKIVKAKAKYLSMQDIDMCYFIKKITSTELVLSYVGRDNTLNYLKNTATIRNLSKQGNIEIPRNKSQK